MKHLMPLLLLALASPAFAQAPSVTLTTPTVVADGSLVPVLTWTSSPQGPLSCIATGGWSGTKAGAGTETVARITATTSFSLSCTWSGTTGTATVTYTPPTTNTDGSALTNLAGHRIIYGLSATALTQSVDVPGATVREKVITGLAAGTWFFAARAYNSFGTESANSNIASKAVTSNVPFASANVGIVIRPVPNAPILTTVVVAGINYVPVFRVAANGVSIGSTLYGLIPVGRPCGAKVATWRGKPIHRVTASVSELWGTSDTSNLAAPCA